MSMAFILMMIWLGLTGLAGFVPSKWRAQAGLALLVAGPVLVLLALVTGGLVTGLFALGIVITVYPGPVAALGRAASGAIGGRLRAARTGAAA